MAKKFYRMIIQLKALNIINKKIMTRNTFCGCNLVIVYKQKIEVKNYAV